MKYKIVADSSTDINEEMKERMNIQLAPLTLEVDGVRYIDDESFDVPAYLEKVSKSPNMPKSSCPSPEDYLKAYRGEEEAVFVITLSAELSGSYSTAVLAKKLLEEEDSKKKIYVFNSRSATSGQVAIALKIQECIEANLEFEEIIDIVEAYIAEMVTIFVLEKIDHLQKAGRMSKTKATLVNVLNIKLVLKSNDLGEILLHSQARGTKKALDKMIESIPDVGTVSKTKKLVISHCEDEQRAIMVKEKIEALYEFEEIIIVSTKGLSSNYANQGGIVVAY